MYHLLSVSMPRSGHHVIEKVMTGLFRETFAYCEFYGPPNCCRQIPCSKIRDQEVAGKLVFVQKSHDHQLNDPAPSSLQGILVQVRDPVARAVAGYEIYLAMERIRHSREYQQFWFGREAVYTAGFFKKWCGLDDPRVLVLHYEDLVRDPVAYFSSIFGRFSLPKSYFDEVAITRIQRMASSGGNFAFKVRDPIRSKYYDEEILQQYSSIVATPAEIAGYRAGHADVVPEDSALSLSFGAFAAFESHDYQSALDAFDRYLSLPDAHCHGLIYRARALRGLGRNAEAESDLRRLLETDESFEDAYLALAELQYRRRAMPLARETLKTCLAKSLNPGRAHERMKRIFPKDPELIPNFRLTTGPMPSPEQVVTAFRYILGREPQSETVVREHQATGSVANLRARLFKSAEFANIYEKLTGVKRSIEQTGLKLAGESARFPVDYVPPDTGSGKSYHPRRTSGLFEKYMNGEKILDIGFKGDGHLELKRVVPHAIGVDLDFPGRDGIRLPFKDESIDCVFSNHCLAQIPSYKGAIQDWYRVTKTGGFIVCIVPSQSLYEKRRDLPSQFNAAHKRFYTPKSLLGEFEESLEENFYRVRLLEENDREYDYNIDHGEQASSCYEIVLVVEKIKKPNWNVKT